MQRIHFALRPHGQQAPSRDGVDRPPSRKRALLLGVGALASLVLILPTATDAQAPPNADLTITVQDNQDPPANPPTPCAGVMTFLYEGKFEDLCKVGGKPKSCDPAKGGKDCPQPKAKAAKLTGADGKVTYTVKAAPKDKTDSYVVAIKAIKCVCDRQFSICVAEVKDYVPFTVDDKGVATAGSGTTRSFADCP